MLRAFWVSMLATALIGGRATGRLDRTEAVARVLLCLEPGTGTAMTEVARRLGRDPSTATRFVDRAAADAVLDLEANPTSRVPVNDATAAADSFSC